MDRHRLKKAHNLLEKGQTDLQKEAAELNQVLVELQANKALVEESCSGCEKKAGDTLSAMACWNINDFSGLANQIIEMIEQRIRQQKEQLAMLHEKIKKKKIMAAGLERLLIRKESELAEQKAYSERQEFEESLLRERH